MDKTKTLDIIAYYLSEFDMLAFQTLGFEKQTKGFDTIAPIFGKKPSYLRRLRDEYDVVTSSKRKGQGNRKPRTRIIEVKEYLTSFSFGELTEIIKAFIENPNDHEDGIELSSTGSVKEIFSEEELESILNFKDHDATIKIKTADSRVRVYNTTIIKQLKKLYGGRCQLCGGKPLLEYDADICEAHHIDHFSESHNNDASNIIILCPNHHSLIHKLNPSFNPGNACFSFENGKTEKIRLDMHLL